MTEPLTVDELERQVRNWLYAHCTGMDDHDYKDCRKCAEMAKQAMDIFELHSRQLWLEAAKIAESWPTLSQVGKEIALVLCAKSEGNK